MYDELNYVDTSDEMDAYLGSIFGEDTIVPCYECGDEVSVAVDAEVAVILCDSCQVNFEYAFVPDLEQYI